MSKGHTAVNEFLENKVRYADFFNGSLFQGQQMILPEELEVTAITDKNEIMGIKHKKYLIEGVQFHPEAILSEQGHDILRNFIKEARERVEI